MREAKICDIPTIIMLLGTFHPNLEGVEFYLSTKIRDRVNNLYLIDDSNTILVIYERVGLAKCQTHAYILPRARGKAAVDFLKRSREYAITHYKYSCFLAFVPSGSPHIERFLRLIGYTKMVEEVKDAGGEGISEALYIFNKIKEK